MQPSGTAHPHALPGVDHAPPGVLLPASAPREAPRPTRGARAWLDVLGGIAFAYVVSAICIYVAGELLRSGGWPQVIGWESVWLVTAMLCAPLMPGGIRPEVSWASTREGLLLAWPALLYAVWVLGLYVAWLGALRFDPGPVGMSLAVGTAEEFVFRVLLLGWLVTKLPTPQALAVSSVVFGLAHLHEPSLLGVLSVAPQTSLGFVFGAIYLRTRNPIGPILVHAIWDFPYFMALGIGVSGGGTEAGMPTVASLVPWLAFTVYGLWLVRDGIPLVGRVDPVGCSCRTCSVHPGTVHAR